MEFALDTPCSPVSIKKNKLQIFGAELFGMALFVTLSLSNIVIYSLFPSNMSWEGVAIAWGFNLLMGIKIAQYGNAYLNPCIAFCDYALAQNINLCEFCIYVSAELIGAFLGAAVAYSLNYKLYPDDICNFFGTSPAVSYTQAFFIEMIGTALFSMCIFKSSHSEMKDYIIALSLTAIVLSLGFHTSFSYNWARDFGPRLFSTIIDSKCMSDYALVPFFANFIGASVGWYLTN